MPRPLWSGTITFGLVTIPVNLYTAVKDKSIHFHMMSPDGTCRLRRKLYCPKDNKEYSFSETSKGYEIVPGQYVLVDKERLKELKPEKGEELVITQFVDVSEIDPIYFQKTYFVGPQKGGNRTYKLLHDTMVEGNKVAVGQFVMRDKQYVVVLRPLQDSLVIHTMNYFDEVIPIKDIPGLSSKSAVRISAQEKKMAVQLLEAMTSEFNPKMYHDEYKEAVEDLIEHSKKKKKVKLPKHEPVAADQDNVINLMKALKKSLGTRPKSSKRSKKKTSTRSSKKRAA